MTGIISNTSIQTCLLIFYSIFFDVSSVCIDGGGYNNGMIIHTYVLVLLFK